VCAKPTYLAGEKAAVMVVPIVNTVEPRPSTIFMPIHDHPEDAADKFSDEGRLRTVGRSTYQRECFQTLV